MAVAVRGGGGGAAYGENGTLGEGAVFAVEGVTAECRANREAPGVGWSEVVIVGSAGVGCTRRLKAPMAWAVRDDGDGGPATWVCVVSAGGMGGGGGGGAKPYGEEAIRRTSPASLHYCSKPHMRRQQRPACKGPCGRYVDARQMRSRCFGRGARRAGEQLSVGGGSREGCCLNGSPIDDCPCACRCLCWRRLRLCAEWRGWSAWPGRGVEGSRGILDADWRTVGTTVALHTCRAGADTANENVQHAGAGALVTVVGA